MFIKFAFELLFVFVSTEANSGLNKTSTTRRFENIAILLIFTKNSFLDISKVLKASLKYF